MSEIQGSMKFELLPNEILIECFEYLNAIDLLHSFEQLNYRLNELIRNVQLQLNFQDINKSIFDKICTKMLQDQDIKSQVYSLQLSDKGGCPQIKTFLSLFSFDEFSNLRSLTVVGIGLNTDERINSILPLLPPLYYLHLDDPRFYDNNKLADLPLSKLRTLTISRLVSFVPSTHETTSIMKLTIFECSLNTLDEILKYTPMLQYLNIQNLCRGELMDTDADVSDRCALHLKRLIIKNYNCKFEDYKTFLKQTPNLQSLTIDDSQSTRMVNARRWEYLITSSLPYLNIFKFKFGCFGLTDVNSMIEKFKQFQTDFWQEQHHWYTEYENGEDSAFIYTIPYMRKTFEIRSNIIRYCNNLTNNINTFDHVTDLTVYHEALTENCQYYFSNITSLRLTTWNGYRTIFLTTKHLEYI